MYRQAVEILLEEPDSSRTGECERLAFEIFERSKARSLLDRLGGADTGAGYDADPIERVRVQHVASELDSLRGELWAATAAGRDAAPIAERIEAQEVELDHLQTALRTRNRQATTQAVTPLTVPQVQDRLDAETALVAWASTPRRVFAFIITRDRFALARPEVTPGELAALVLNLGASISTALPNQWKQESHRLHELLARPVRAKLDSAVIRWIVVPDGILGSIPVEILIESEPPEPPRFLVESYAISYVPSAGVLARADREWAVPPLGLLAVAASHPEDLPSGPLGDSYRDQGFELQVLKETIRESRELVRRAGAGSRALVEAEGSERSLKSLPLERFRVLHFAAHALLSRDAPERSALVLSREPRNREDGFLQCREVTQIPLRADLVVLSSCRSARGLALRGEGELSLARAFLQAGARSVVATLGDVEDRNAARFMQAFYRQLAEGQPKTDALRRAKLEILRQVGPVSPRAWAPFVLIGEPLEVVQLGTEGPSSKARFWALGLFLALAGAVVFLLRSRARL